MSSELANRVRFLVVATCQDLAIASMFLNWIKTEHAPDLLKISGCSECRIYRLADNRFANEYLFESQIHLDDYLRDHAPALRAKGRAYFSETDVVFERSVQPLIAVITRK